MIEYKLKDANHELTEQTFTVLQQMTEGYSCADLNGVVKEAAMSPMREMPTEKLMALKDVSEIRKINIDDFKAALKVFTPSVSKHTIAEFAEWQRDKGSV